jgi:LemA protein
MRGKLGCLVVGGVLAFLLVAALAWGVSVNNRLTEKDVAVDRAWADVENVYQRRMDLIPNLVETVKGAAAFEERTFREVTEARARASQVVLSPQLLSDPQALARFEQVQGELSGALSRLLATVENYPQLRATEAYRDLLAQLEGTENRISVERRRYNEAVQDYNRSVRVFPASVVAGMRGFAPKAMFRAQAGADVAPKVRF